MEGLGINGGAFIVSAICFLILFAIGLKFWPNLIRALMAMQAKIQKIHEDAAVAAQARANAEEDAEKIRQQARQEANHILEDTKGKAEVITTQMITEAQNQATAIRKQNEEDCRKQLEQVLLEARQDITNLAIAAAERVITDRLSDHRKDQLLIHDFFTHVPDEAHDLGTGVTVISAIPLLPAEQAEIEECIGAVQPTFVVDPSILGGLIVNYSNGKVKTIDGSVRTKLNLLRTSILQ